MLRAFTVGFQKVLKSCISLLVTLPGLIDTLCTVARLKVPAMIVFDVVTKVLGTEGFPQHNIAELNSGTTLIVLLSQEEPSRWKEINTQTHTRTHTHLLPATDKKCPMDSFPRGVPAVQFHNRSPFIPDDIEICRSYMTALSSHNIIYVLVQWSPLQRQDIFILAAYLQGSNQKFNVLSQRSPEKMLPPWLTDE